ncbi:MAG: DoxX family protein [Bacteroidota bacterium]
MQLPWHLYLMALLYILAGINHFRKPDLYIKIIPPYFPNPKALNAISGVLEIVFGILLCVPYSSSFAAVAIIALLVAVFPANLFMYQNINANMGFPRWILLLRLPLQIVLIIWAYQYTPFIQ